MQEITGHVFGSTRPEILTFGKKSSYTVVGEDGEVTTERENYERDDFKFTTSNKKFNFLQHIMTILNTDGGQERGFGNAF